MKIKYPFEEPLLHIMIPHSNFHEYFYMTLDDIRDIFPDKLIWLQLGKHYAGLMAITHDETDVHYSFTIGCGSFELTTDSFNGEYPDVIRISSVI